MLKPKVTNYRTMSSIEKVGRGRKLKFSDRQLQISTEKIVGAQNFDYDFAPKFSQNGDCQPRLLYLGRTFSPEEYFLTG